MKNLISLLLIAFTFVSCKKDLSVCKDYKEISGRESSIDPANISVKEMRDTLIKYPQLEVYRTQTGPTSASMNCRVYYQNLLVFTEEYSLFKTFPADTISSTGAILQGTLNLSLTPEVSHEEAIKKARLYINLDHSCISYQLGLFNKNRWMNMPANYCLAYKISDSQNPYIYVIIDAVNRTYLYSERGVYWVN